MMMTQTRGPEQWAAEIVAQMSADDKAETREHGARVTGSHLGDIAEPGTDMGVVWDEIDRLVADAGACCCHECEDAADREEVQP